MWLAQVVGDPNVARFPIIDIDGQIVATGIGSLELGVPNPFCPQGRTVRLANVITHPEHRRKGYGTWSSATSPNGPGRSMPTASTSAPRRKASGSISGQASSRQPHHA